MRRRALLMLLGGLHAISGCLRFQGAEVQANSPDVEGGARAIEALSLKRTTSVAESWTEFTLELSVSNSGSRTGVFEGRIQSSSRDTWTDRAIVESSIPAGARKTITTQLIAGRAGEKQFRVEGEDIRTAMTIVRSEFALGEEFRHPDDQFSIRMNRFETMDVVQYETDEHTIDLLSFPSGQNQFGFLWFEYSSDVAGIGPPESFFLEGRDGTRYSMNATPRYVPARNFVGRFSDQFVLETGPTEGDGQVKTAWVPFVVPKPFELQRILVSLEATERVGEASWMP